MMEVALEPKILIVDDEVKMCSTLKKFLTRLHYGVEIALDGYEALLKAKTFQPHCILLDIRMPQMDGLEVLRTIKQHSPDSVVIMVSALTHQFMEDKEQAAQAFTSISKPVKFDVLSQKIEEALQYREDTIGHKESPGA